MVAAKMDTRDKFTEFDDRTVPKKKAAGGVGGELSPLNAHFHLKSDITELILVFIYI